MDSDYLQERQVFRRRVIACYGEKARLRSTSSYRTSGSRYEA